MVPHKSIRVFPKSWHCMRLLRECMRTWKTRGHCTNPSPRRFRKMKQIWWKSSKFGQEAARKQAAEPGECVNSFLGIAEKQGRGYVKTSLRELFFLFFNMGGTGSHSGRGSEMNGAEEEEKLEKQSPWEARGEMGTRGWIVPRERKTWSLVTGRKPWEHSVVLRWRCDEGGPLGCCSFLEEVKEARSPDKTGVHILWRATL